MFGKKNNRCVEMEVFLWYAITIKGVKSRLTALTNQTKETKSLRPGATNQGGFYEKKCKQEACGSDPFRSDVRDSDDPAAEITERRSHPVHRM